MQTAPIQIKDGSIVKQPYDSNNNPLRIIVLRSKKAEIFASYQLINKDLGLVISALNAFQVDMPKLIKQSITFFTAISYAKCFVSNKGGRTVLDSKKIFKDANEKIKNLHKNQIDLRMDYIAHAGNTFEKCVVTATLYPTDINYKELNGFSIDTNMAYMHSLNERSIVDFKELCSYVQSWIGKKISDLEAQIQEELYELGDDELIKRSILPIKEIDSKEL